MAGQSPRSLSRLRLRWILLATLALTGSASASPIAVVSFVETEVVPGSFRYDYTLTNGGDPVLDAGLDAYDLAFFFPVSSSVSVMGLPTGWDSIVGAGFVDTFSLIPGAAPIGADVGPGSSLGLFSLVFGDRVGPIAFQVVFANPTDTENPVLVDGVTQAAVQPPAEVPEPASLILLSTGIATVTARLRRRRTRESTAPRSVH